LASVIVTYNPPAGLASRIDAVLAQTDFVVIVDNGSAQPLDLLALPAAQRARIFILANATNIGLAAALNQGISRSAQLGASKALLLDHDSTASSGLVQTLCDAARTFNADVKIAAVVPGIRYAHPNIACRWPSSVGHRGPFFHFVYAARLCQPTPVDLAIGSGMLVSIEAWEQLGRFGEHLFVDLVDTEFCLRARAHGYQIIATPRATLQHELGHVIQRRLCGLRVFPTHHSAIRHYYINRNRIILAKRYARRFPSWLTYELLGAFKLFLKTVLFESDRLKKLRYMLWGTIDGLTGRSGPISRSA